MEAHSLTAGSSAMDKRSIQLRSLRVAAAAAAAYGAAEKCVVAARKICTEEDHAMQEKCESRTHKKEGTRASMHLSLYLKTDLQMADRKSTLFLLQCP